MMRGYPGAETGDEGPQNRDVIHKVLVKFTQFSVNEPQFFLLDQHNPEIAEKQECILGELNSTVQACLIQATNCNVVDIVYKFSIVKTIFGGPAYGV